LLFRMGPCVFRIGTNVRDWRPFHPRQVRQVQANLR
jgi:hypothetical protein